MTKLYDILDWAALQGHIQRKEITERKHPEFPNLVIYNYADVVAYQKLWTPETRAARGLIVDLETMDVLARPFAKFFNYGQQEAGEFDLDAKVMAVTNKFDGSLGIGYRRPDGKPAIATRGSFDSDQARHATALVWEQGAGHELWASIKQDINFHTTPLYEIIYPENRIVVDYADADMLIALGRVRIEDGSYQSLGYEYTGQTLRSVLAEPNRANSEGWVVWMDPYTAVKIKQQDYIELHRIVTGLNRKSIWRALSQGEDVYNALVVSLPDELFKWARSTAAELREQYATIMREVDAAYLDVLEKDVWDTDSEDDNKIDRKKFAGMVALRVPKQYSGYVFALADNKDIQTKIWKQIEPRGGDK